MRRNPPAVITLLTDFGAGDVYVGTMKGVILRGLPEARIVDLCHQVRAQDVRAGAFMLLTSYRYFPPGTVHLAVVDPGVGGPRRLIAGEAGEHRFLGPDNGVLWPAMETAGRARAVVVDEQPLRRAQSRALPPGAAESTTFHGRDRFAPLACLLAEGVELTDLGEEVRDPVRVSLPEPRCGEDGAVNGEVIHVDGFGNLITNLRPEDLPPGEVVFRVGGRAIVGLSRAYVDAEPGVLVALVGSSGRVEISLREGSAAAHLAAGSGAAVAASVRR